MSRWHLALTTTLTLCVGALVFGQAARAGGQATTGVEIDADDIGGVVRSARGPEAGVWVIAETTGLPTRVRKIVVTDEQGRYLLPDLPVATFDIWVRGYGLIDSPKVRSTPGRTLALTATLAPDAKSAAAYYPANYWLSLLQIPPKSEFPGTGATGNGIAPTMTSQAQWIHQIKANCEVCHQLGTRATRELPPGFAVGEDAHFEAWNRRVEVGQDAPAMIAGIEAFGRRRAVAMFSDWTDRIAAGELPPAPPRPQGLERNLVQNRGGRHFLASAAVLLTDTARDQLVDPLQALDGRSFERELFRPHLHPQVAERSGFQHLGDPDDLSHVGRVVMRHVQQNLRDGRGFTRAVRRCAHLRWPQGRQDARGRGHRGFPVRFKVILRTARTVRKLAVAFAIQRQSGDRMIKIEVIGADQV